MYTRPTRILSGIVAVFFFFFQAEDGIRDDLVTGVQTCALPISCGHRLSDNVGCPRARSQKSGAQLQWEAFMARRNVPCHAAFLAGSILALPAMAADVTPDRLVNAGPTPLLPVPFLPPLRRHNFDPSSQR